ncbi:hydantoinase/oxoprolinase family protein [Halioxenophilus sp. WMMB6]|uniref:hydantoinase/oxoprolinase family protein n=1 Tax=Halioxenophilus sp. WMMB6 TaxID=3073815 RepID=UPI00295E4559|nr:hydantoinase/oxoprolinase family protein [Halioxenophilus sp. WMMB6]
MTTHSSQTRPFSHLVGVDTGGTFTDFVAFNLSSRQFRAHKVLSTPANPALAIVQGLNDLGLAGELSSGRLCLVHGSTVATNAALERKGVRTAFITNRGLADLLSIGRQTRPHLYHLQVAPIEPPVAEQLCLEADCRLNAQGETVTPLTDQAIAELVAEVGRLQPEAVAINLLFSYLDDSDEQRLAAALAADYFVARSSYVLPEPGEYERGMATWLNAYLGPRVEGYLNQLKQQVAPCPLSVMQSNGGTIDAEQASQRAVNLLLSGPAGGLAATQFLGRALGESRFLTFDMGGTSTDVALIDGDISLTTHGRLADWPVAVPMVDMHTIGAGGGSLARVDGGGLLQVGPQSAGASPGPACYGRGGIEATVTDANLVLGRLPSDSPLGGHLQLDRAAAEHALQRLAERLQLSVEAAAAGVVSLVNEHMTAALRVISVNRGRDPRAFTLCCFGGAGGLHVCALADNLGMTRAVVPAMGGVFSALGMLTAEKVRQLSLSKPGLLRQYDHSQLQQAIAALSGQGSEQLAAEGVDISSIEHRASVDLRYQGQSFTLNVGYHNVAQAEQDFHTQHEKLYGHRLSLPVELVTIRVRVSAPAELLEPMQDGGSTENGRHLNKSIASVELAQLGATKIRARQSLTPGETLTGPAIIWEPLATTLVAAGWHATVDNFGNILLTRS